MLMINENHFKAMIGKYVPTERISDFKKDLISQTFSDDDPFLAFAEAMRKKVSIKVREYNRRKDPWNHEIEFLVDRFEEEIEEFFKPYRETGELKRDELVDIGNFAMFIWKLIEIEKLKRRGP